MTTARPAPSWSRGRGAWIGMALLAAMTISCGYRLAGGNTNIPERVRRIAVPVFENRTQQPDIAQRLTESIVDEFISRGDFATTSEEGGADAVLRGTVTLFQSTPIVIDNQGLASRYEILIQIQAELVDLTDDAVLWKDDHFVFRSQYDVQGDPSRFFDQSILGIDRVSVEAARSVVASILEGF